MVMILSFFAGALIPTLLWLFWPEDKEVRYLRGVLAALKDTEHDRNNMAALDYWEETSWRSSAYDQDCFDRGYRSTISDLQQQLRLRKGEDLA